MTCYHPNYLVRRKIPTVLWIEAKYREKHGLNKSLFKVMKDKPYEYRFLNSSCVDDKTSDYWKYVDDKEYDLTPIPCGNCLGCRLDYSRQWANRCYCESLMNDNNYFVTLTYDDAHVQVGEYGNQTLVNKDFTTFLNSLRKYYERTFNHTGIRYFGCGEYGDSSLRPHFHFILFNCPIPDLSTDFPSYVDGDLVITQHSSNGEFYYYSKIIADIWKKGNILIGKANWQTMAYVARYVMKKQKGKDADVYQRLGIEPPFVRMSRMPGIGMTYYDKYKNDIYKNDNIIVYHDSPEVCSPPRAFDKRFEKDCNAWFNDIKVVRKDRQEKLLNDFENTNYLHYLDSLERKEEVKQNAIASLHRLI